MINLEESESQPDQSSQKVESRAGEAGESVRPIKGKGRNRDKSSNTARSGGAEGGGMRAGARSRSSGRARHSGITEEVF